MEYQYDSDISEDTRDLISKGLATDTRKYTMRPEIGSGERDLTLHRNMNASHVRLPPSQIVSMEEPSARGLNTLCERNVVGQNHNNTNNEKAGKGCRLCIIYVADEEEVFFFY